ncbi:asparaginase domain-containing protein [Marinicella sp. W31]|uniref:asparaginase domain-containing protein n=1 Tax=Marinicella sp. W31 TaxID=3023713 RepID=UPI0037573943
MKRLTIITTGGTIDKLYFDELSEYQIGKPVIGELLTNYKVGFDFEVLSLMKKDSLDITDEDRQLIHTVIERSDDRHFLITHGTDTMVETARYLSSIKDKTMVLTGALTPARFNSTDAIFNIGCAVAAVQTAQAGAWIVMNGQVWNPENVRKNRKANQFEATD